MILSTSSLEDGETATVLPSVTDLKCAREIIGTPLSQPQVSEATHIAVVATDKISKDVKTVILASVGPLLKENSDVILTTAVETASLVTTTNQHVPAKDNWARMFKGSKQLSKKGGGLTLSSGEACVKIPDSVV